MKRALIIILVVAGLISCEKEDSLRINVDEDYFPLQIGNQWIFELAGKDSVIGVTKIDGMDYFEFVNDSGASSYYRKQDNRIYSRPSQAGGKEEMKFDLAANIDDTWSFGAGYVKLTSRNETVTFGDTQMDNCLQFTFFNEELMDYGFTIWLAPGVGAIQQTCQECFGSSFNTLKLETAIINDQLIDFR